MKYKIKSLKGGSNNPQTSNTNSNSGINSASSNNDNNGNNGNNGNNIFFDAIEDSLTDSSSDAIKTSNTSTANSNNKEPRFKIDEYEGSCSVIALKDQYYDYKNDIFKTIEKLENDITILQDKLKDKQNNLNEYTKSWQNSYLYNKNNNKILKSKQNMVNNISKTIFDNQTKITKLLENLTNITQKVNDYIVNVKQYKFARKNNKKLLQRPTIKTAMNLVREMHHGNSDYNFKLTLNNTNQGPFYRLYKNEKTRKHKLGYQVCKFFTKKRI